MLLDNAIDSDDPLVAVGGEQQRVSFHSLTLYALFLLSSGVPVCMRPASST
jgi:hypothetical protein